MLYLIKLKKMPLKRQKNSYYSRLNTVPWLKSVMNKHATVQYTTEGGLDQFSRLRKQLGVVQGGWRQLPSSQAHSNTIITNNVLPSTSTPMYQYIKLDNF